MDNFDLMITHEGEDILLWLLIDYDYAQIIDKKVPRARWYLVRSDKKHKIVIMVFNTLDLVTNKTFYHIHARVPPIFNIHFKDNIKCFRKKTRRFSRNKKQYDLITYLYFNFGYISDHTHHLNPENIAELSRYMNTPVKL